MMGDHWFSKANYFGVLEASPFQLEEPQDAAHGVAGGLRTPLTWARLLRAQL